MSTYIVEFLSWMSKKSQREQERKEEKRFSPAVKTELVIHSKTMHYNEVRSAGGSSEPGRK